MSKLDYNKRWGDYFQVSEESPSGLIRIKDGETAGSRRFNPNYDPKAWKVGFEYKEYFIHRIIWVLTYGSIDPALVIDHNDGNPFNNKISNLSLKTVADNSRNQHKFRSNTTGITGVTLFKNKQGHLKYIAHWQGIDGKRKLKHFSVNKFGEETAKALAIAYREDQIQRLISEGEGYTERHGVTLERKIS